MFFALGTQGYVYHRERASRRFHPRQQKWRWAGTKSKLISKNNLYMHLLLQNVFEKYFYM